MRKLMGADLKETLDAMLRDMRRKAGKFPKEMARVCQTCLGLGALLCLSSPCFASEPGSTESARCRTWVLENFGRAKAPSGKAPKEVETRQAGLFVLENYGPIQKDGRSDGRALKLGDTEFKRGLLCHAESRVIVRLPDPGRSFVSTVGVDANAGGGSVVFSVTVAGKEAFRSGVTKGSEPGVPVSVDLGGASEFTIAAGDAGDNRNCDHAAWADAKVTLTDGKEIWLSDLPIRNGNLPPRHSPTPAFSFVYDGKASDELLANWKFTESAKELDENRIQKTQTYLDPKAGLEVRVVMVQYNDFPAVEWTLYFKNTGKSDTPILEGIQALDTAFERSTGAPEFKLHHFAGSLTTEGDFEPFEMVLGPNAMKQLSGASGRATGSELCYFNLEMANDRGLMLGLGWPGQWAADFARDADRKLRVTCGQELTHLKLHPGEEIRTPLVVVQFWQGSGGWTGAQNAWRRWMVAHNMPRPNGKVVAPQFGGCGGNVQPRADEEIAWVEGIVKDGVKLDHWIIDAGWYPCKGSWPNTGTWEVDKTRFPKGLREVADRCHANGIDFIVWFEPERAAADTWLTQNHPEWILGGANGGLVNMGNQEAWKWVTNHIDGMLVSEGIDHYRSDYNIGPLDHWRKNDAPDRQGITENLYVQGFLAFWDELLRRHPKMYIDTCSGGGGRLDLETLRRSVPLLRSDWPVLCWTKEGFIGQQCQTHSLALWLPYFGTGAPCEDMYSLRSSYSPAYRVGYNPTDPKRNVNLYKQAEREMRQLIPYWLGDYYPLTPYSREKNVWLAWQLHSPEKNAGAVQAFRRGESAADSMQFSLGGLKAEADYLVTNADTGVTEKMNGKTLMNGGLRIAISDKPGSTLITYKNAN